MNDLSNSLDLLTILYQEFDKIKARTNEVNELYLFSKKNDKRQYEITQIKLYEYLYQIIENNEIPIDYLSVEDAFSRYLLYCKPLSSNYYFITVVDFIILFYDYYIFEVEKAKMKRGKDNLIKESMDESSNTKKAQSKNEKKSKDKDDKAKNRRVLNAKTLPELSNTFILEYLPTRSHILNEDEAINLIYHLCYNLHEKGYTTTLISMVNQNLN